MHCIQTIYSVIEEYVASQDMFLSISTISCGVQGADMASKGDVDQKQHEVAARQQVEEHEFDPDSVLADAMFEDA